MGEWVKVGKPEDFVEGRGRAVDAKGVRVAVFRVDGALRGIQDFCPHMGASLADGRIEEGRRVTCHMHGWTFDLRTGRPRGGRANCAKIYDVETRDGDVWVRVPDPPRDEPAEDEWVPWSDDFLRPDAD